jgi:hypothetical protein
MYSFFLKDLLYAKLVLNLKKNELKLTTKSKQLTYLAQKTYHKATLGSQWSQ